jgi:hypothetical protein
MRRPVALTIAGILAGCGSSGGIGDDGEPDAETPRPGPPGPPGCGLDAAAFCDTFDAPTPATGGREGDLDSTRWSVTRASQAGLGDQSATIGEYALPIGNATIPTCRVDVPARVLPGQDVLVCDTIDTLRSNTLMIAAAEQNYGQAAARIRAPFDFAARTGRIVLDATLEPGGLLGWVALSITEDPVGAPSYLKVQNEENGAVPRNALEIHFNQNCQAEDQVSVSYVIVITDYLHRIIEVPNEERHCVSRAPGLLNRVVVDVSSGHVAISASPASTDGVTFAPVELLTEQDISLPFTSGYVHLGVFNHASLKYSDDTVDAYVARFDNVGFDGPVLPVEVAAQVPDSRTPVTVPAGSVFTSAVNIGHKLGDLGASGFSSPLSFTPIDLAGATSAQLTLIWWSLPAHFNGGDGSDYELAYRLNGGATHTLRYSAEQLVFMNAQRDAEQPFGGSVGVRVDVDLAELVSGTNTIQLATTNVPTSYPPVVSNIDLLVAK